MFRKMKFFFQNDVSAIFFDGRIDLTLFKEKVDDRWYSKTRQEDHYVLVGEPEMVYLDHILLKEELVPKLQMDYTNM